MNEEKQPKLNPNCPCKYGCPRHGNCKECRANHKGGKTSCQKLAEEKKK